MLPEFDHYKTPMCLCVKTRKAESHSPGMYLGDACASAFFSPSGFCMPVSTPTKTSKNLTYSHITLMCTTVKWRLRHVRKDPKLFSSIFPSGCCLFLAVFSFCIPLGCKLLYREEYAVDRKRDSNST